MNSGGNGKKLACPQCHAYGKSYQCLVTGGKCVVLNRKCLFF